MAEVPLKVLVLAPTPFFADRGCHVRILEEARAAIACGVQLRLVTYHLGRDPAGLTIDRTAFVPWYKKLEAGPSWHKLYLDLLLLLKALQVALRAEGPYLLEVRTRGDVPMPRTGYWDIADFLKGGNGPVGEIPNRSEDDAVETPVA